MGAMSKGTIIVYSFLMIILFTVTRCDSVTCTSLVDCESNNSCKKNFNNGNITCRSDYLCSSNCSEPIISWKVIDSEIGMLEVMFQLPQSKCNKNFKITLLIDESLNASTCNTHRGHLSEKHSWRIFSTDVCKTNGRNCSGTVVMYFKHVYTGCYQFHDEHSHWKYSPIQYIKTNYVKTYVEPVIFDCQYTDKSLIVITIINDTYMPDMMVLTLSIASHSCHGDGLYLYRLQLNRTANTDNSQVFCYPTIEAVRNPECTYMGNNAYSCKFFDILPMNYCIRVEFEDEDRCQQLSVWNKEVVNPCSWSIIYSALEVTDNLVLSSPQDDNTSKLVIVLFGVIGLIVLIAIIFYQNKEYKWLTSIISNPIRRQTPATYVEEFPSVVLLYARDCPLFMDTMAHFRTVLYTMGCQVYDYWDPARFDEVAESPTDWIRQHIDNKAVRFVIVSTPISRLLEQTVISGKPAVEYKEPRNFDKLFLYSLKDLEKVIINESYKRIFVVSVHNSTHTQNNALAYLNPLTVYSLPTHLDKLLHTIKNKPFEEFTDIPTVNNVPQVQEFISLIQDLEKKYGNNLDYINNIIDCI